MHCLSNKEKQQSIHILGGNTTTDSIWALKICYSSWILGGTQISTDSGRNQQKMFQRWTN